MQHGGTRTSSIIASLNHNQSDYIGRVEILNRLGGTRKRKKKKKSVGELQKAEIRSGLSSSAVADLNSSTFDFRKYRA